MKRLILSIAATLLLSTPAWAATRVLVLPFEAPQDVPGLATLGPGTMDSLITGLMRLPDFIVVDRATTAHLLKEQALSQTGLVDEQTAVRVGRLLGAQAVISGRIQIVADKVRITASFVDAETGRVRKAEQVTGRLEDVFDLQDQLAGLFLNDQGVQPTQEQAKRLTTVFKSTANLKAYDLYQQGRTAFQLTTYAGYRKALQAYDEALRTDPGYALAWAGKAETLAAWGWMIEKNHGDYKPLYQQAQDAAQKAIQLREDLPEAHRAMSYVQTAHGQQDFARISAQRAIALAPNDAENRLALWFAGKQSPDDAEVMEALRLNPRSIPAHLGRGLVLGYRGRLSEALAEAETGLKLNPDSDGAHMLIGAVMYYKGHTKTAIEHYRQAVALGSEQAVLYNFLGDALASVGDVDAAITAYKEAYRLSPTWFEARENLHKALKRKDQNL